MKIPIKTPEEIDKLRESAQLLTKTFREVESELKIGITTQYIDDIVEGVIKTAGGRPAFKGYNGFPASACISIDCEVVHGIPDERQLENGQIVSIDIGVDLNGYYSDASKTYPVGEISDEKKMLVKTTRTALHRGIKKCRSGNRLSDISHAIQTYVESKGYSVVRDLVGHGIGTALHEPPQIPNYGPPRKGPKLEPGMVFAIEPMVNIGASAIEIMSDGWTVKTADRKPSGHFEHTVLITDGKPEILTLGIEDSSIGDLNGERSAN